MVKPVFLEQILVRFCLLITLAVRALEHMRAWFVFLGFRIRRVKLVICLATPPKLAMVFRFVWTTAFYTFYSLNSAR